MSGQHAPQSRSLRPIIAGQHGSLCKMSGKRPLQPLIAAIEKARDNSFVCDRGPLEDMLGDLRRWASQLDDSDLEPSTLRDRPRKR